MIRSYGIRAGKGCRQGCTGISAQVLDAIGDVAGTVAQVVQPGYMIGERVLRPALVAVAKGGPKLSAAESPANDNAD